MAQSVHRAIPVKNQTAPAGAFPLRECGIIFEKAITFPFLNERAL
jgi:hypothetical protein